MGDNERFTNVYRQHVGAALDRLGIRVLVFAIQESGFPPRSGVDTGRGSPYSAAGLRLLRFVRALSVPPAYATPALPLLWACEAKGLCLWHLICSSCVRCVPATCERQNRVATEPSHPR
jgi:hypothetical protein